jgi:hypothetical protein
VGEIARSEFSNVLRETEAGQPQPYPRTLILENDSTAREEIGRPIDIAGRNVVKISILFTCGSNS